MDVHVQDNVSKQKSSETECGTYVFRRLQHSVYAASTILCKCLGLVHSSVCEIIRGKLCIKWSAGTKEEHMIDGGARVHAWDKFACITREHARCAAGDVLQNMVS